MNPKEILYELVRDKINGQALYNRSMAHAANPLARDLFRTFRDQEEECILLARKKLQAKEAKPPVVRAFLKEN